MDRHDAAVLAALEQQLLEPAVRRLRRRFCAGTAGLVVATVGAFALLGLAALPVLYAVLVSGALLLVARTTDVPAPPIRRVHHGPARARHQPLGCSTKS
jgi:hypothetical protein